MGSEFTFYDYIIEQNVIQAWFKDEKVPLKIRIKFDKWLLHLEGTPVGQWKRPLVDTLPENCEGLFEIRAKLSKVQYRILGCHGPGQRNPTLLFGFIKLGDKVPDWACKEALDRKDNVYADPANHRERHNYQYD